MSHVIAALNRDHANVAKLLNLLESEILAIGVGKTPDYSLLQDIMRYMTYYPDRFHHPKEDVMFTHLLKREPGVRSDVDDLMEEHVTIGLAGRNLYSLVRTPVVDSVDAREQLRIAGLNYVRALREHMSKEERNLFTLAKVVLTESEWRAIDEEVDAIEDPLFGTMVADEYERLYQLIFDPIFSRCV